MNIGSDGILTISGRYFGSEAGSVIFDKITYSFSPNDQQLESWTDTEIKLNAANTGLNGLTEILVTKTNGKKTGRTITISGNSGTVNAFGNIQSFKDYSILVSKYITWLVWSEKDQSFTVQGEYELPRDLELIGGQNEVTGYLNSFNGGSATPFGFVYAGLAGSNYSGRGFDSFYVNQNGLITDFGKYASFSDLFNTISCYSDGYLFVWGNSSYNTNQTVGYMAYTRLVKEAVPEVTLSKDSYVYNGKTRKPSVTVKVDGFTLTQDKDYTAASVTKTITVTVK